jgi:hypothetical protein
MNDKWKMLIAGVLIGAVTCGAALFGVFQARIRDSRAIIAGMEAENRDFERRLGSIQGAVDSVAGSLGGAAGETGEIADGVEGVIAGIDESIRILGELTEFFGYVESILGSPGLSGP